MSSNDKRELLRHTVATVAYRGGKAIKNVPPDFKDFRVGEGARTPGEILAHIGDLFDWGLSIAAGKQTWHNSTPLPWEDECARFFAALQAFDSYLASDSPLGASEDQLFQGPVADALQHIGQINILRRVAGGPIKGENYFRAEIEPGRVGSDQSSNRIEFD